MGRSIPGEQDPAQSPNPEGPHERDNSGGVREPNKPSRQPDPEDPSAPKRPIYLPPNPD